MVPSRPWCELALVGALVGCGWLPPDSPPKQPQPPDPDLVQLVHAWKIADHVLANGTTMSERDAAELNGRTVEINASSYKSPWHGSCDDAARQKRDRVLADVTSELEVSARGRATASKFGLADGLVEYTLSCTGTTRTPPLTLYVAGTHAMTCFGGVCYLMSH